MPASDFRSSTADSPAGRSEHRAVSRPQSEIEVAIVIVTYNSAQLTIEALQSLLPERGRLGVRLRAYVIDNASGDLQEIAKAVKQKDWSSWVTLVMAPINGGFSYGSNLGIETALSFGAPAYIYLLNPDTQVRSGAVGALVHFLEAHPQVGIAGGSFENLDGSDWPLAFRFPNLLSELNQGLEFGAVTRLLQPWTIVRYMAESNERVDWVCGAAMMIRTEVFAAIGGLDENFFLYFEETDFCRRAGEAGFATWYVPDSRVMHIGGQSTAITTQQRTRLPAYWFESRRRYFVVAYGIRRAMAIDVISVIANLLGRVKHAIQRRPHRATPFYIRDILHHSVLWKRNRTIAPARTRLDARPHSSLTT
jgi:N-acetylglucosaminyl-diphospho-decaprenol L-rhamnosyltransferase